MIAGSDREGSNNGSCLLACHQPRTVGTYLEETFSEAMEYRESLTRRLCPKNSNIPKFYEIKGPLHCIELYLCTSKLAVSRPLWQCILFPLQWREEEIEDHHLSELLQW
jgi:hypothetical protein